MSWHIKGNWVEWDKATIEEIKIQIALGSLTDEELLRVYWQNILPKNTAAFVKEYLIKCPDYTESVIKRTFEKNKYNF